MVRAVCVLCVAAAALLLGGCIREEAQPRRSRPCSAHPSLAPASWPPLRHLRCPRLPGKRTPFGPVTPCHQLPKPSMVTRTSGDQFLRLTAINSRARIRSRLARTCGFRPVLSRSHRQRSAREPDRMRPHGRPLSAGLSRLLLALALILLAGCSRQARAQTLPTPLPQPTPDKTMDAVIRGLVTVVVPTPTRPPAAAATAAPARSEPAPRPAQVAATSTPTRVQPSPTAAATPVPITATSAPRAIPTPDPATPTAVLVPNRTLPTPPINGLL